MSKTLLVVEADPDLRKFLSEALEALDFAVVTAATGRQALARLVTEAVSRAPVDGILLDLEVTGVDALTTLRDIRDRHEGIPVVIISEGRDADRVTTAMQDGAVAVLRKPVNLDLLRQIAQVFFNAGGPLL
jgi:DNA-binding NtrC family response regulator